MPTGRQSPGAASQPSATEALALVIGNVYLSKPTSAALRLVCKTTRLTIDGEITTLVLKADAAKKLRAMGSPLASGLNSLRFHGAGFDCLSMLNASLIAVRNVKSLEVFAFSPDQWNITDRQRGDVLAMLGACDWPKLRSLTVYALPNIFTKFIDIDMMPEMTKLRLYGKVTGADVTALSRSQFFPSHRVEVFSFLSYTCFTGDLDPVTNGLGVLLCSSRLRRLSVSVVKFKSIDFLPTAYLPYLNYLSIAHINNGVSLAPITAIPRSRLQILDLQGSGPQGVSPADMLSLVRPGSLPVLKELNLNNCKCGDWSWLREMHITLKK
jgi:hypothetical protein